MHQWHKATNVLMKSYNNTIQQKTYLTKNTNTLTKLGFLYFYEMQKLHVSLFQIPLVWENPQANRDFISQKIASLPYPTDLVVLPEMFSTGFTMQAEKVAESHLDTTVIWMQSLAQMHQCAITGSIIVKENNSYFNRLYFVTADAEIHFYDKRHLFSYAGEDKIFSSGNKKPVLQYKDWKICPLICYDLRFPVWSRNKEDYDLLLYVANWPDTRIAAWDILLQARAVENLSYCIGVNRTGTDDKQIRYPGHSGVYNALGENISDGISEKESIITAVLDKDELVSLREKFRFLDDRDTFSIP